MAKRYRFLEALSTKGSGSREQVDSLEPVCFTLAIVSENDVEPWATVEDPAQVAELVDLNRLENHMAILTYWVELRPGTRAVLRCNNQRKSASGEWERFND